MTTASRPRPAPPRGLLRWLLSLPTYLYRAHLGFLLGHRFLVLVNDGRRTGRRHETPLEVLRYDPSTREAIVAAGWGRKTQWLHNVEAGLAREVWIGRDRYVPSYRTLDVGEAAEMLESYEDHSGLPKGFVRSVLSRLLGWRYDGSADARRRAVEQLPLLGFRPAAAEPPTDWIRPGTARRQGG
jgi:deazaflavin-dependent oxidoreductase (nitroreductase family)